MIRKLLLTVSILHVALFASTPLCAADQARQSLVLLVKLQNSRYQLVSARTFPREYSIPTARSFGQLDYEMVDNSGKVLHKGRIADPTIKHGPMPLPGEPQTGHAVFRASSTAFYVIVPYEPEYSSLKLRPPVSGNREKLAAGQSQDDSQTIDLTHAMAKLRQLNGDSN